MASLTAVRNNIRVLLDDECGEGNNGDYDPSDPSDVPLMRFSVQRETNGGWVDFDDASYCTQIDARLPQAELQDLTDLLLRLVYDDASKGYVKKIGERLSWIDKRWLAQDIVGGR